MNLFNLTTIVIEATALHHSTIIYIHGLNERAENSQSLIEQNFASFLPGVKFVIPQAPKRPMTCFGGLEISAWYDLQSMNLPGTAVGTEEPWEDIDGISKSATFIHDLVKREALLVGYGNIYLGGHSQGGALALYASITMCQTALLGGIFIFSGYLAGIKSLVMNYFSDENKITLPPLFYSYGGQDLIIPAEWQEVSLYVTRMLFKIKRVEIHKYPNKGHEVSKDEMESLISFFIHSMPSSTMTDTKHNEERIDKLLQITENVLNDTKGT